MTLAILLVLLTLVAAMSGSIALVMQKRLASSAHHDRALRGKFAAEAGIQRALVELHNDQDFSAPAFTGTLSIPGVGFEVEMLNNRLGTSTVVAPDGTNVPPGRVWMRSVGVVDGQKISGKSAQVTRQAVQPIPEFNHAVYVSNNGLRMGSSGGSSTIDSYAGPNASTYTSYYPSGPPRQAATLFSYDGYVGMGQASDLIVDGNVYFSSTERSSVTGTLPAYFSGTVEIDTEKRPELNFVLPISLQGSSSAIPGNPIPPGRYGHAPNDRDYVLLPGEYYFESFSVGIGKSVKRTSDSGPTTIYTPGVFFVSQDATVNYGSDPADGKAEDFRIYSVAEHDSGNMLLTLMQRSKVVAVFAGYNSGLELIGGELYGGAIVMNAATIIPQSSPDTSTALHYDESLKNRPLGGSRTEWVLVHEGNN